MNDEIRVLNKLGHELAATITAFEKDREVAHGDMLFLLAAIVANLPADARAAFDHCLFRMDHADEPEVLLSGGAL